MTRIISTLLALLIASGVFAQHNFVIQNGNASVHKTLLEAYEQAQNGDTLYLPGGEFSSPTLVEKSLVWVGVGHNPDSSSATYFTAISTNFYIAGSADNSSFTGIYFKNQFNAAQEEEHTTGLTFERCRFGSINLKTSTDTADVDWVFEHCVVSDIIGSNAGNVIFNNCLIFNNIRNLFGSNFNHCSINDYDGFNRTFQYLDGCQFINCVISLSNGLYNTNNCTFKNNIFGYNIVFPQGTNTGIDNIVNVNPNNIYTYFEGDIYNFSYNNDYHLQSGSLGIGYATDGTNVGVFGGSNPFKTGSVPSYPHIRLINIDEETTNGLLPVEIKVEAQLR